MFIDKAEKNWWRSPSEHTGWQICLNLSSLVYYDTEETWLKTITTISNIPGAVINWFGITGLL